jgi:hypothetical protein
MFMLGFRSMFTEMTATAKVRLVLVSILSLGSFADNIACIATQNVTYFAPFARPFIFALFVRSVRETMMRIWYVIKDAKGVIILLFLMLIFYSYIGVILFGNQWEGEEQFDSFHDAFWHMLIVLTTANYPDVMMPAYANNRWNCLFFISFLCFGLFFLLNLILAIFYNNYRKQVESRAERFQNLLLEAADQRSFRSLGSESKLDLDSIIKFFQKDLKKYDMSIRDKYELLKFLKNQGFVNEIEVGRVLQELYYEKQ